MKGFFIEVTNNLLDPKHRKKMGTAVWEFMWCLDKITKIDDDQVGYVLGGKPINLRDIRKDIGITEPKISKNLTKLENEGYIKITHAPYGLVIKVIKAQKRFNQKGKPGGLTKRENPMSKRENLDVQKGKPNKTRQLDNTVDNTNSIAPQDGATVKHPALASFKKGEKMVTPVGELIDLFKHVNPKYQDLFKMKGQHRAAERMIIAHGFEKMIWLAEQLPKINAKPFAPMVVTPYELEKKLPKIIAYIQRLKAEKESGKKTIHL